jgi:hypothetical protein
MLVKNITIGYRMDFRKSSKKQAISQGNKKISAILEIVDIC